MDEKDKSKYKEDAPEKMEYENVFMGISWWGSCLASIQKI